MTVSHMLTVKAAAALILAGSATAMPNLESKLADGPAQTYWWCEMHHAPQNIQSLVQAKPNNLVESLAKTLGTVEASQASAEDLRTKIISYSGPKKHPEANLSNDPVPPQTFWCEMHQGAQSTLTAAETEKLSASLAQLPQDALVARVIKAERKASTYLNKVKLIQAALKD
eukprot:CAMPEP_0173096908 /NCGR_PEP_ID=MMETSP1102-20130122/33384_1 /TAXON_ID=49646 /ORGANISM="Geminigera sp., Strain Caron Lab Isolate" /LENGTH=170 /DNA_ID=CAMNT_0013988241 /DNA_START=8 /DNA_END=520 /DNA_ORIENTATION=-